MIRLNASVNDDELLYPTIEDISSSDKEDIESIIDTIDEYKDYRVNLNYDDSGYVNEFIISDK